MIVDVICLELLYTLRIIADGLAVAIPLTPWLLALSMFLFLSLAIMKRMAEPEDARITEREVTPAVATCSFIDIRTKS